MFFLMFFDPHPTNPTAEGIERKFFPVENSLPLVG